MISTFEFAKSGGTIYPASILKESDSDDSEDEDEEVVAVKDNPKVPAKSRGTAHKNRTLTDGFETMIIPDTSVPVGFVSRTIGEFYSVSIPGAMPVQPPNS